MSEVLRTIESKRDGAELTRRQIREFVRGFAEGAIPEYQASALLMAIFLNGMTPEETVQLTEEMLDSGRRLEWPGGTPSTLDKHSTGGVGDKTSLIIAPLLAASGYRIPMISGRGLGATGGTLDKLESIPGFRTDLSLDRILEQADELGCVMVGATKEIAPADRKLYALRDVTATVASIPLITASILSKKLAEGLDGLVLDVKWGSGAFMQEYPQAKALAESLVRVSGMLGVPARALLTDMNQPLGVGAGNAIEVNEAIDVLQGAGPPDVRELSLQLCVDAILLVEPSAKRDDLYSALSKKLDEGTAWELWTKVVHAQGGKTTEKLEVYAPLNLCAKSRGWVEAMDTKRIGEIIGQLGGGRQKLDDVIDPAVGLTVLKRIGDFVEVGEPILQLHVKPEDRERLSQRQGSATESLEEELLGCVVFSSQAISGKELIVETINDSSIANEAH